MNFKICCGFQHVPKAIAFGRKNTSFRSNNVPWPKQRLIVMAQNIRSAQSYINDPILIKKNLTFEAIRDCFKKTNVFRSNDIGNLNFLGNILKAITNFKIHQNLFKYVLVYFITLCQG